MSRQTADNAKAGQGNDLAHADRGLMDRPQSDCAHVHETSAHRVDIPTQLHAEHGLPCEVVLVGMRGDDVVARFESRPFACSFLLAYSLFSSIYPVLVRHSFVFGMSVFL